MKTLIGLFVWIVLTLSVLGYSATKPRVYSGPEPPTKTEFDNELRDLFRVIPTITAQNVFITSSNPLYVRLPHNYGSPDNYAVSLTANTGNGIIGVATVERYTGDSLRITKYAGNEADTGTVSLITIPIGIWGE